MSAMLGITFFKHHSNAWKDKANARVRHKALSEAIAKGKVNVVKDDTVAFHLQGDEALNTEEAFEERGKIRRHASVLAALDKWWLAVQQSAAAQGHPVRSMCKEQYLQIYRLLYFDLLGEEDYDEKEADAEGLDEWQNDSKDGRTMERTQFLDAIFEVCDLYTEGIDPQEYADWLSQCLTRMLGPDGCFMLNPGGLSLADRQKQEEEERRKQAEKDAKKKGKGKDGKGGKGGKGGKDGKGGKKLSAEEMAKFGALLDGMSDADRALLDGMSDEERARFLAMSPEEREAYLRMLAGMSAEERAAFFAMSAAERAAFEGAWRAGGTDAGWNTTSGGLGGSDGYGRGRSSGPQWRAGGTDMGWKASAGDSSGYYEDKPSSRDRGSSQWRGGGAGSGWQSFGGDSGGYDEPERRRPDSRDIGQWRGGGTSSGWNEYTPDTSGYFMETGAKAVPMVGPTRQVAPSAASIARMEATLNSKPTTGSGTRQSSGYGATRPAPQPGPQAPEGKSSGYSATTRAPSKSPTRPREDQPWASTREPRPSRQTSRSPPRAPGARSSSPPPSLGITYLEAEKSPRLLDYTAPAWGERNGVRPSSTGQESPVLDSIPVTPMPTHGAKRESSSPRVVRTLADHFGALDNAANRRGAIRDTPLLVTREDAIDKSMRELERRGEDDDARELAREVPQYVPARDIPKYVEYTRHARSTSPSGSPPIYSRGRERDLRDAPWRQEAEAQEPGARDPEPAQQVRPNSKIEARKAQVEELEKQQAAARAQLPAPQTRIYGTAQSQARAMTASTAVRVMTASTAPPSVSPTRQQSRKPRELFSDSAPPTAGWEAAVGKRSTVLVTNPLVRSHVRSLPKTPSLTVCGGKELRGEELMAEPEHLESSTSVATSVKPGNMSISGRGPNFAMSPRRSPSFGLLPRAELGRFGLIEEPPLSPTSPASMGSILTMPFAQIPFGLRTATPSPTSMAPTRPTTSFGETALQGALALARAAVEQEIAGIGTPAFLPAAASSQAGGGEYATLGLAMKKLPRPKSSGELKSPPFSTLRSPREVFDKVDRMTGSTSSPALPRFYF